MAALKTTVNDASVEDFINRVEDEVKRHDSLALLKLFSKVTGEKPKMWHRRLRFVSLQVR